MKFILFPFVLTCAVAAHGQPTVSFTFDDGVTHDRSGYAFEDWNQMILDALAKHDLKAAFFVTGFNKSDEKGKYLLNSWDGAGHLIANHTFTHPNFNSANIGLAEFQEELLGTDTLINQLRNYTKLFRFPYLKEGETAEEVEAIRAHLASEGYRNGYVTIDASDWYIDSRLRTRLSEDHNADLSGFRDYYLAHLLDRATYYEELAFDLTGRHIKHTLLLHQNLTAAFFLDDLIEMFKAEGWVVVSAEESYEDEVFEQVPTHGGESLIWALAKDRGTYELRYPAEDSRYEEDRMNELGL